MARAHDEAKQTVSKSGESSGKEMLENPRTYYVSYNDCTAAEPGPGWYASYEYAENGSVIYGPFSNVDKLEDFLEEIEDECC